MSDPKPPGPRPPPRRNRSPLRYYLLLLFLGAGLVLYWDVVGFFVFLLFLGGGLSYLGDQLGSYCGKQRLSILGLRPKYTAGLINLGTGLLITIFTFVGAVWMSEDVRVAVFRVRELRNRAERLRKDVDRVQEELVKAQENFSQLTRLNQAVESEKAKLSDENAGLASQNDELAGQNVELASRNSELARSNQELEGRREALNRNIQEKLVEIDRLNLLVERKETAPVVISRRQMLVDETAAVPMDVTTEALRKVVQGLTRRVATRVQLLDVKFDQQAARFLVQHGVEKIQEQLAQLEAFYRRAVEQGKLRAREMPQQFHISPVSTRNVSVGERLARVAFDVRPDLLVFGSGDEVARTVIDAAEAPAKILDQLLYFDQQVRTVLRERGVDPGVLRRRAASDPQRLLELVRIADSIHSSGGEQIVRCVAAADLTSFGDAKLRYMAMPEVPSTGPSGTTSEAADPAAQVASRGAETWSFDLPDAGPLDFELILPEPTLSAGTLLQPGGGLGAALPEVAGEATPTRKPGS